MQRTVTVLSFVVGNLEQTLVRYRHIENCCPSRGVGVFCPHQFIVRLAARLPLFVQALQSVRLRLLKIQKEILEWSV